MACFGERRQVVQSGVVSGSLDGSVGLLKNTDGATTLSGSNFYAGGTTVAAGTLLVAGPGILPSGWQRYH